QHVYFGRHRRHAPQRYPPFSGTRPAIRDQQLTLLRWIGDRGNHAQRTIPPVFCALLSRVNHHRKLCPFSHACLNATPAKLRQSGLERKRSINFRISSRTSKSSRPNDSSRAGSISFLSATL